MIRKLKQKLFEYFFGKNKSYGYLFVSELPKKVRARKIYICQNQGFSWQANMQCPCGCRTLLYLNLLTESKPYWKYEIDFKRSISIYPSIHRKEGCKSHFIIRKGGIIWS